MKINLRLRVNMVSKLGMGAEIADHVILWTNRAVFLDTEPLLQCNSLFAVQ